MPTMSAHRNIGVVVAEFSGDLPCGFADGLDEMNQGEAKVLVRVVRLT